MTTTDKPAGLIDTVILDDPERKIAVEPTTKTDAADEPKP